MMICSEQAEMEGSGGGGGGCGGFCGREGAAGCSRRYYSVCVWWCAEWHVGRNGTRRAWGRRGRVARQLDGARHSQRGHAPRPCVAGAVEGHGAAWRGGGVARRGAARTERRGLSAAPRGAARRERSASALMSLCVCFLAACRSL